MKNLVAAHRAFARSERNRRASFRIGQLEALRQAIADHREALIGSLAEDLGKPETEAYAADLAPVIHEITFAKRHLRRWMRRRRTGRGAFVLPSPFGAALVIGTWNYPVQLTLSPVVAAIAAGNGVTVKPSEVAPATAAVLRRIIESTFEPEAVSVVLGGPDEAQALIDAGYDKVFFTGSPRVGAMVAERAARHHSDVTLELGGKSPAIVDRTSDLRYAARRIVWGKLINAGQTCMAPDYALVPTELADELIGEMRATIREFLGDDPASSADYARIVNERHFDRITTLTDRAGLAVRTDRAERYVEPTIVRCDGESPLMDEELFAPILPVLSYDTFDELAAIVDRHRNPLAVYVFTKNRAFERRVLSELDFGGGMVNDVIMHVMEPRIPFGGRGSSGTGAYHGRFGFDAFSHMKGVARTRQGRASSFRFPPYRALPPFLRRIFFGV